MKTFSIKISTLLILVALGSLSVEAQEGFIKTTGNSRLHYRIFGVGADTLVVPDGAWQYLYYEKLYLWQENEVNNLYDQKKWRPFR
jgi:hypothetical protein